MPRSTPLTRLAGLCAAALLALAGPAGAALKIGADAPDFSAEAALGGQSFRFNLAEALKQGPVVLYFYPKAYTSGCTVEAHQFAEATERFKALGATVIGMSNDDIATLKKFSVEACRNKFAVAADAGARIIKQYDAGLTLMPGMADRISYVISPQGKVLLAYSSLDPDGHVDNALKAIQAWRAGAGKP
jgi:peroxiredoxin